MSQLDKKEGHNQELFLYIDVYKRQAEASSIVISEKPSGYLICTSPELLKKAVSVKVMVDQAIKNKTPVLIMGNIDELELLWETLPQQMVMDVFTRPITVGDMVDNVCTCLLYTSEQSTTCPICLLSLLPTIR